jgi:hypothetical protein
MMEEKSRTRTRLRKTASRAVALGEEGDLFEKQGMRADGDIDRGGPDPRNTMIRPHSILVKAVLKENVNRIL